MSGARSPRSDGLRNRALLIAAAREVFAARGLSATLDDIAAHAGVGTGTAYRHFANKRELAGQVLAEATEQIETDAVAALAEPDPWEGLVVFFERTGQRQVADRGLYETLTGQGDAEAQARIWPRIVASVTELVQRCHAAGALRADVAPQDIAVAFAMLGPVFEISRALETDVWRRYLGLVLDGLRTGERSPLPLTPPPLAELDVVVRAGKRR